MEFEEYEQILIERHTLKVHKKIRNAKVGVAGLGGLGSNVAVSLARSGIGQLLLIDFDIVEPSNLNRQQYFIKHLGMKKTDALKQILKDINPFITIETMDGYVDESNACDLFKDVDVIVEAFDNPISKAVLVNTLLEKNIKKPIVAASGVGGYGPSNHIKTRRIFNNVYLVGDGVEGTEGFMAPRVAIAANHQANMVLRLILDEYEVD